MEEKVKFRFVFKHNKTGDIEFKYYPLGFLVSMIVTGKGEFMLYDFMYTVISKDRYTGLKDKSGNEIYENDIFSMFYGTQISVVTWDIEYGCWSVIAQLSGSGSATGELLANLLDTGEVTSNIHKNPELLKEQP